MPAASRTSSHPLRAWQASALEAMQGWRGGSFLVSAAPPRQSRADRLAAAASRQVSAPLQPAYDALADAKDANEDKLRAVGL